MKIFISAISLILVGFSGFAQTIETINGAGERQTLESKILSQRGGGDGGGGSDNVRAFSTIAYRKADVLEKDPSTAKYAVQIRETLKVAEIHMSSNLHNDWVCDGKVTYDHYAYSCKNQINLLYRIWDHKIDYGWLHDLDVAETHWKDILHEIFRAGDPSADYYQTNDENYSVTAGILEAVIQKTTRVDYSKITIDSLDDTFLSLAKAFESKYSSRPHRASFSFNRAFICYEREAAPQLKNILAFSSYGNPFVLTFNSLGLFAKVPAMRIGKNIDLDFVFEEAGLTATTPWAWETTTKLVARYPEDETLEGLIIEVSSLEEELKKHVSPQVIHHLPFSYGESKRLVTSYISCQIK